MPTQHCTICQQRFDPDDIEPCPECGLDELCPECRSDCDLHDHDDYSDD